MAEERFYEEADTAPGRQLFVVDQSFAMTTLLFNVQPTDPASTDPSVGLVAVALLASYLPARRTSRIDPLLALRSE